MDQIDRKTVKHVALLSRLTLNDNEIGLYSKQLASILSYISKLNEIDTSKVAPTSHVLTTLSNVFRKDELKISLEMDGALANAPAREGDYFKVPQVIESSPKGQGCSPEKDQAHEGR